MWTQSKEEIKNILPTLQRGYAKIDLDAIESNMDSMHENIANGTKMLGVIKTNGYGHGATQIAKVLENKEYIWGYAVAAVEEAYKLREDGIKKPILILSYTFPYCYEELAHQEIRTAIFREDSLDELNEAASRAQKKIKVHIAVDTGMSRIGITPDAAGLEFVKKVIDCEGIELEGIFTHFAKADEEDKTSALEQMNKFKTFTDKIKNELGFEIPIKHCSNSAGILEISKANMDMVRAGITLYGLMPSDQVLTGNVELRPAMSIYSHISYVKTIHAGQSVSYGGLFTADKDTRVATIPLGYGDGYPRGLSNKGSVLIGRKRCRILGRVCMDQFMVDVTECEDVKAGDEVTLIGGSREEDRIEDRISAEEIGDISGRFNYELVCLITARLPRVYVYKGEIVEIARF